MGWFSRKPKEPQPPTGRPDLRALWLSRMPEALAGAPVAAVLADIGVEGGCVTVMAGADGSASVVSSNGGGTIGYGNHPGPAAAAKSLVQAAGGLVAQLAPAARQPLPPAGSWAFCAVTPAGVRRAEAREAELGSPGHPLHALFAATHGLITACRMQDESAGRGR